MIYAQGVLRENASSETANTFQRREVARGLLWIQRRRFAIYLGPKSPYAPHRPRLDPDMTSAHGAAMARRRNRWGTLEGGEQNQSMQQYVLDKTMADKEHKRWLAHKDAALHATFPTSLELNGIGTRKV